MGEIMHHKKSMAKKIKARWPVILRTRENIIEAESRTVTEEGILINCEQKIPQDETFRMIIMPRPKLSVTVSGELKYSNVGRTYSEGAFSSKSLSFIRVLEKDRHLIRNFIQRLQKVRVETVKKVKLKVEIDTDRRTIKRHFRNFYELKLFMQNFYSLPQIIDRRSVLSTFPYSGPERRIRI